MGPRHRRPFERGDHIVYRKPKSSPHPGPRAEEIRPRGQGEDYAYRVDKFWTVSAVFPDGTIEAVTRTGKVHRISPDDPNLRRPGLLEHLFNRRHFPDGP